jgi:hypothetical protein
VRSEKKQKSLQVADPHHFNADSDPAFRVNADPDPAYNLNADPGPDPDPVHI